MMYWIKKNEFLNAFCQACVTLLIWDETWVFGASVQLLVTISEYNLE